MDKIKTGACTIFRGKVFAELTSNIKHEVSKVAVLQKNDYLCSSIYKYYPHND